MPIKRKRYRAVEDSSDESDVEVDIQEISDSNSDARSPFPAKKPSIRHRKKQEMPDVISQEGQTRSNRSCSTSQSKGSDECGLCFEEKSEVELLRCTNCQAVYHSTCLNLPKKLPPWFKRSLWRCKECKICEACNQHRKEIEVVTCGNCDRAFHFLCLNLKLDKAPSNGWVCPKCAPIVQENMSLTSPNGQVTVKRKRGRPRMVKPAGTSESSQTEGEFERSTDVKNVSFPSTSMGHETRRKDAFSPFAKRVKIKKCPIQGCDGQGHITGKFEMHHTVSGCPNNQKITLEKCKGKAKERRKEAVTLQPLSTQPKEHPKKALRSKVQLSFMPEKIRAAVTSKEITPEGHNAQHVSHRKCSQLSDDGCFVSPSPNELEANSIVTEELEEDLLQVVAPGKDFRMFKEAWTKALEANEEEVLPMNERPGCRCIEFGSFEIDTWYSSPYPEEFQRLRRLYICEFCLKYMKSQTVLRRHLAKCNHRYPPGDEIYRKNNLSIFEVDGKNHKVYCQNLCLLAKLFLDHKTLYYDVEPFLFYVMTKADSTGCHMIGYFSKEKKSFLNYNVSCILTLPMYMKQGYGKMLIDFSYLLSRVEEKVGSPEKPLSDLGLISYRSYWKGILIKYLKTYYYDQISVKDISQETAIHPSDVVSTLQYLGILKYWKGKHVILRATELFDDYDKKVSSRPSGYQEIDPDALSWKPPVVQDRT